MVKQSQGAGQDQITLYVPAELHRRLKEALLKLHGPFEAGRKKSEFIRCALEARIDEVLRKD